MKKFFIATFVALTVWACNGSTSSSPTGENLPENDPNISDIIDNPENPGDTENPENPDPNNPEIPNNPELPDSSGENPLPEIPSSSSEGEISTFPSSSSQDIGTPKNYAYYGAELSGTEQFKYGRFEARMKMVSIPGSVSSMFLYYDDSWMKDTYVWNEIDIEVIGKSKTEWQANIITREGNPSIKANTTSETKHEFGFDATEDFHLYAIVWTPEYVAWEIDSVEIRRDALGLTHGTHADADQVKFLTETQTLRFNLWASKSAAWTGKFTGEELADGPQIQWIDYVRVYDYDANSKNFSLRWQDDFNGSDVSSHWSKGNWEMENVMLSTDNVVVENGYCKLLMTRVEE